MATIQAINKALNEGISLSEATKQIRIKNFQELRARESEETYNKICHNLGVDIFSPSYSRGDKNVFTGDTRT